jgi:imidazolonepropionase-like amidohydrolase
MRRLNSAITALLALGFAAGFTVPARAQGPTTGITAFEGVRLIVGDGRAPIENATLIVDGAKLVQAGRAADVRVPANAKRVSLAGKTVMPALIDAHVHTSETREALTQDLRRMAYFGVGAAMSLGLDPAEAPFEVRATPIPGAARFALAGRGITAPEPGRDTSPYWVTTEDEARQAVRANAAKKVNIIKIWVDDRNGKYKKLTPDLYGAVIDEAHRNGLRVTAHIFALEDAKGLLRAGVDAFAHGVRDRDIDDEFMALLKQHPNLVLNPNMGARGVKTDLSWLKASLPAADFAKLETANSDQPQAQARYAIQARNLAKMNAAGVRIVLGTDTDGTAAWATHLEMEDMVVAGLTPMQVIVAATRNAAEFVGIRDAGTLEAGKSADFIVLDANPVDDITNTRRISSVYLRGAMVDRKEYP